MTINRLIRLTRWGGRSAVFLNAAQIERIEPGNTHYDRRFTSAEGTKSEHRVGSLVLIVGYETAEEFDQTPDEIAAMLDASTTDDWPPTGDMGQPMTTATLARLINAETALRQIADYRPPPGQLASNTVNNLKRIAKEALA